MKKSEWQKLKHEDRLRLLSQKSPDQIVEDYSLPSASDLEFRSLIQRENRLWNPANVGKLKLTGAPPTKDVVLGAWRDLERAEAILELIDNSIDVWLQRKRKYPNKSAPELNIYIDIDSSTRQLSYEDNAGGVSPDKIQNLVVPGFSDTTSLSPTIGSYKTGGKKAIFRLGTAVQILTRYWNPAETSDDAFTVQLDEDWINDPTRYEFLSGPLNDNSAIERGQTRYQIQLREEPIGGTPWFDQPSEMQKLIDEIRTAYTLLMVRNPAIHIYVKDRAKPLPPKEELYEFSGAHNGSFDIRPQQVVFETQQEFQLQMHPLEIEIVLGCRKTTGVVDGHTGGIDLYGNDRLFVSHDQQMFADLLPAGNVRNMVRGFVNIKGPNVFIPWDTHKRHLNLDREIITILTKHVLIKELFDNWRSAFMAISKSPAKAKVSTPLEKTLDRAKKDLFIPHRGKIVLDPKKKRGVSLTSENIFVPKVDRGMQKKADTSLTISFQLTTSEARQTATYFGVEGDLSSKTVRTELGIQIKDEIMSRTMKTRK